MTGRAKRGDTSPNLTTAVEVFDTKGPLAAIEFTARQLAAEFDASTVIAEKIALAKTLRLLWATLNAKRTRAEAPPPKAPSLALIQQLQAETAASLASASPPPRRRSYRNA